MTYECPCGMLFFNPIALREHKRDCMSYEAPEPDDESGKALDFDSWMATHHDD